MSLLWKLIRLQISPWQLAGFSLANLLGLIVVLLGIQFYSDTAEMFTAGDSFMKQEYVVLSKEVGFSPLSAKNTIGFTEEEMRDISSQPFVSSLAPFVSADFSVVASISSHSAGVGFQTEMFLEALLDEYIDVDVPSWRTNETLQGTASSDTTAETSIEMDGQAPQVIPIIIPRNYLNLYNFGFAAGRGLPTLSESVIGMVPITLYLSSSKGHLVVEGRVMGFSNRLNTILVPMDFMQWANDSLGQHAETKPTRLCLNVKNPADPLIGEYIAEKGYRTEGTNADAGRIAYFLRLICFIVVGIGCSICVLAFFVMLLSIYLLLQKNMEKVQTLRLLGYSIPTICMPYFALIIGVYAFSLFVALFALSALREQYIIHLVSLNPHFNLQIAASTYCLATGLTLLLIAVSASAVWIKVKRGNAMQTKK
ncbi:MAG: ABC transporter permease [Bacteroidaceae bacterium]|nr:ABC transporter permease [Bacteroidaceae bacterium]